MQRLTLQLLGYDLTVPANNRYVRIGWQQQGQPAQGIEEDVTYLRCTEIRLIVC